MRVHKVKIKGFRLLADVELVLEKKTTVIVGRNNSGKTSLSEIIRRVLTDGTTSFQLEDFSSATCDRFYDAYQAHQSKSESERSKARELLPTIELRLHLAYDSADFEYGPLARFIVDLDPDSRDALSVISYELKAGEMDEFFADLPAPTTPENQSKFLRVLRKRIPTSFAIKFSAEDPKDASNCRQMKSAELRHLIKTDFVNAQRGLDDVTSKESNILAKVLEGLFSTADSAMADVKDKNIAKALKTAVQNIQSQIDNNFGGQLQRLLPTLQSFGYPGLGGQELRTETTLEVDRLLSNFTKVRYAGHNGLALPESYNGLGVRNLIFILLQLVGFYRSFRAESITPGVHLVFIEEPEAHLHPQMQQVFIRKLAMIAQQLVEGTSGAMPWPVQFIVSTHSPHIANEAEFDGLRYFLSTNMSAPSGDARQSKIKDLREGFASKTLCGRKFLQQYLTLTRCDLFFADKAVIVEGLSERLMLPIIIEKLEADEPNVPKISTQYTTIMEVGGAYAHIFLDLFDFLELRVLIVTDLDAVVNSGGKKCAVHKGTVSSNACLNTWFPADESSSNGRVTLNDLKGKTDSDKQRDRIRIAYQCAETENGPCGRTFEDAFILANPGMFKLTGATPNELESAAEEEAARHKKSHFALKYAIVDKNWNTPKYLLDGIRWLAADERSAIAEASSVGPEAESVEAEGAANG